MNPKTKKRIIVITILILISYLVATLYVKINTNKFYNATEKYLIENKGYKKSDISKIEIRHSFLSRILSYQEWNISVTFYDEPTARYYYSYDNNKITQSGASVSGNLDDGIYDHEEYPGNENIRIAGRYIKQHGYTIFNVLGELDRYTLSQKTLTDNYKQIWSVQKVNPKDYFGKEIVTIAFKVRNHPLQQKNINAKDGVRLFVMIANGKAIGGYSLPLPDTVGGCYSFEGKTKDEI